jgi:hypothetical protein
MAREQLWYDWKKGNFPWDYGVKLYRVDMIRNKWQPKLLSPGVNRPRPSKQLNLFDNN